MPPPLLAMPELNATVLLSIVSGALL